MVKTKFNLRNTKYDKRNTKIHELLLGKSEILSFFDK
jgi:hypothetical protein